MAQDYQIVSQTIYVKPSGTAVFPGDYISDTFIGGADIDDGTWDVDDFLIDYNNGGNPDNYHQFIGHYTAGGHLFLVFENANNFLIHSPSAASTDPGYPSNYVSDPPPVSATSQATCFAAGTQIATPGGERAVEDLEIGDLLRTASGDVVPVRWIGRQTLHRAVTRRGFQPVRIRAGALGLGLPYTDLTVTADHGMVIDGLVINASALVNGTTIDWVPMAELSDSHVVYHVETENHDVILANGAAAETFIDYVGRHNFDNHQEYLDLYGAERIIREMPAQRISAARLVPAAIRARLGIASADVEPGRLSA